MKNMKCLALLVIFVSTFSFGQVMVSTLVDNIQASGGLKLGPDHLLYAANFGQALDNANGTQVWKIDMTGQVTLFANGFGGAAGNAFDSQGNLFQSSIGFGTVSKITPSGSVSTFANNGITYNVGIAIDNFDNLYVCNCCGPNGNTIQKVTPTGQVSVFSSGGLFFCPNGITINLDQNLYVSNFSNGNVIKITPSGSASLLAVTPGSNSLGPSNGHIVYSPQENILYVASHGAHNIYRLTLVGELTLIAGQTIRGNTDGPALQATYSRPNGLALSSTGDTLFINTSIPTTNANGRPLNPSKIRMITGLLGFSATQQIHEQHQLKVYPNPVQHRCVVDFHSTLKSTADLRVFNSQMQLIQRIKEINTDGPTSLSFGPQEIILLK